jgi:Arc/MetJ-type ribon-helix-helix transcriptional regulator
MDVQIKPELHRYIDDQIRAGNFSSPVEVIEAGLARLMLDPTPEPLDDETLAAIDEGDDQLDRGEGVPLEQAFKQLRAKHFPK